MPYVKQEFRELFDECLKKIAQDIRDNPDHRCGNLNYVISKLIVLIYANGTVADLPLNIGYNSVNEVMGVLESAKTEFYRMIAAPYEDVARNRNGGIGPADLRMKA